MSVAVEGRVSRRSNPIIYYLQSGSGRVLNSLSVADKLIEAHGKEGANLLFATPALNRGVIFKDFVPGDRGGGARVGTKLYIPFNRDRLAEGGQTFFFQRRDFPKIMGHFVDLNDSARREALNNDMKILDALEALPMFAPFLVRQVFDREKIIVDPLYVNISEEEWQDICVFIREQFQQILTAVTGETSTQSGALGRLLDALWELKDIRALEALAKAFGLPANGCLDSFYAWKGTIYFCWCFEQLQSGMYEFTSWLLDTPKLLRTCPPNRREATGLRLAALHDEIFQLLRGVEVLLAEYNRAFADLFVHGEGPARFLNFLFNASSCFNSCGMGIGILQHAHEVWDRLTEGFPNRNLSFEKLEEVMEAIDGVIMRPQ